MMHRYLYSAIVSLILLSLSAHAQSVPELVTDRPDFTESPVVVPQGAVQLEFGATQEWDGDIESRTLPELLVRWAPLSWLELRLMVPDYITQAGASGFGDAGIGLKFGFGKILGWDAGAIAGVSLPTGEDGFSSESVDPEVLLTIGRDFGESWSFGLQGSALWLADAEDAEFASTIVVGRDIAGSFGTFLELAALAPPGGDLELLLHHGYTLGLGSVVQLDLHGAVGITKAAPDVLLGVGGSVRL